jgi:hypothetical protein
MRGEDSERRGVGDGATVGSGVMAGVLSFGEEDGGDSVEFSLICEVAVEVAFAHSNIK